MSNTQGITTRSKALCAAGCGIQSVLAVNEKVMLACGHTRGQLLPARPGSYSVEQLAARSAKDQKLAQALFPASKNGEATVSLPWKENKEVRTWL